MPPPTPFDRLRTGKVSGGRERDAKALCNTSVPFVVPALAGYVRSFSDDVQGRVSLKLPTNPHKCGTTNN